MKISQVSFSKIGGAGRVAGLISQALGEMGHESSFRSFTDSNLRASPMANPVLTMLASLDELVIKKPIYSSQFSLLRDSYPGFDSFTPLPDILNLHWVSGVVSFPKLQQLTDSGVGLFWTLHDMRPFTGGCHHSGSCKNYMSSCSSCPQAQSPFSSIVELNLKKKLGFSFLRGLNLIAPSHWIADLASNSALFNDSKIVVIPNPIDSIFFSKKESVALHPIPTSSIIFSLIANDLEDPNKRVDEICQVLHSLKEKYLDSQIKLLLIGARGQNFATKYSFVDWLGPLCPTEVAQTLGNVDVNISFSFVETAPLAIAECAAKGVPSVASDNHGAAELLSALACGSTAGSLEELFVALEEALKSKMRFGTTGLGSSSMSMNALAIHSPDKVAGRYARGYEEWRLGY